MNLIVPISSSSDMQDAQSRSELKNIHRLIAKENVLLISNVSTN